MKLSTTVTPKQEVLDVLKNKGYDNLSDKQNTALQSAVNQNLENWDWKTPHEIAWIIGHMKPTEKSEDTINAQKEAQKTIIQDIKQAIGDCCSRSNGKKLEYIYFGNVGDQLEENFQNKLNTHDEQFKTALSDLGILTPQGEIDLAPEIIESIDNTTPSY